MSPLPQPVDTALEEILQGLPDDWQAAARQFGAWVRKRQLRSPVDLMRALLCYAGLDQSAREVAGTLTWQGPRLTDEAVRKRLLRCEPWLEHLLKEMLAQWRPPDLPTELRFWIIDGSSVQAPGAKGTSYRVHLALDAVSLQFRHLHLSDVKTGESLRHFPLGPGDVGLTDRGYCHARPMRETRQNGAHWVIRLNAQGLALYAVDGERLNLMRFLQAREGVSELCVEVQYGAANEPWRERAWVHAVRLPEAQAEKARLRKSRRKRGKQPSREGLYLAGWFLVITSLAPEVLSTATIKALYPVRWQVELAIKRWKSLLDLDALRAKEGRGLARVWLHGKLLYALLLERRTRHTFGDRWGFLNEARRGTWWRFFKLMKLEMAPRIAGVARWCPSRWRLVLQVMLERPRRRRLACLSQGVEQLRQLYPSLVGVLPNPRTL